MQNGSLLGKLLNKTKLCALIFRYKIHLPEWKYLFLGPEGLFRYECENLFFQILKARLRGWPNKLPNHSPLLWQDSEYILK